MPRGSNPAAPRWHVAQTHPQAELWAATNLQRQGYPHYLPMLRVRRRDPVIRSQFRERDVPLFPGYIFIAFSQLDPWTPVTNTRGISRLLMADGYPACLRAGLVEALQAGDSARRSVTPPDGLWAPGVPCRASGGAFAGVDAVVVSVSREKAVIALPLLGGLREVSVPAEWLMARE